MRKQFINSWVTQQQRSYHQSTRGVMDPKTRRALEEEAEHAMAEIERKAAEKALTDLAYKIEATSKRTDNTFTEHAVVEAGGLELLREAAESYRQERKER